MSIRCQAAPAEAGAEQAMGRDSHISPRPGNRSCRAAPYRSGCWVRSGLQVLKSKAELKDCICALNDCSLCDLISFYCFYDCTVGISSTGSIEKARSSTLYEL